MGTSTYRVIRALLFVTAGACGLSGCGDVAGYLDTQEKSVGIYDNWIGADHRQFHRVLHYHNGLGLQFPGYVVGIEKADQDKVTGPKKDGNLVKFDGEGSFAHWALLNEPKTHIVSHVMRYSDKENGDAVFSRRMRACALYSILSPFKTVPDQKFETPYFPLCKGEQPDKAVQGIVSADPSHGFGQSWEALAQLKKSLTIDLKENYSHIFLITMGWNTTQGESIQNFNSIIGNILDEADDQRAGDKCKTARPPNACSFKPLVIGVTWASDWEVSASLALPPALVRGISFPNKASDATEFGITWLRALIDYAVLPARDASTNKPKLVMVGHSFGARATMSAIREFALNDGPALKQGLKATTNFAPDDQFISLEGAYKVEELFEDNAPGKLHHRLDGLRVRMFASEFDKANELPFWGNYAGSISGFDNICANADFAEHVQCLKIPAKSKTERCNDSKRKELIPSVPKNPQRILYIDASEVINCAAPFTGGGSHSDIYRRETAQMLWSYIYEDVDEGRR